MNNEHWHVIAKMYQCPECGWVTECYPNCPIEKENEMDYSKELGDWIMQDIKDNPPTWREYVEMWWNNISGKEKRFTKELQQMFKKGYLK